MMKNESQFASDQVDQKPRKHFKLPIRVAAFLFSLIIAGSTCILCFSQSVFALQEAVPSGDFGILFPDVIPALPDDGDYVLPLRFSCDGSYLTKVEFIGIRILGSDLSSFAYQLPDRSFLTVYENSEWVNDAYRYIYVTAIGDAGWDSDLVFRMLTTVGSLLLFDEPFTFKPVLDFTGIRISVAGISQTLFGIVDDQVVYSIVFNSSAKTISFTLNLPEEPNEYLTVYSLGQWQSDSYRNIRFNYVFVPDTYEMALLFSNNEAPPPSFLDRLTSGFTAAIGWLGDFFTSLFTSNLALAFILVSVGFGIFLLSFGWRWIRRCLWGY